MNTEMREKIRKIWRGYCEEEGINQILALIPPTLNEEEIKGVANKICKKLFNEPNKNFNSPLINELAQALSGKIGKAQPDKAVCECDRARTWMEIKNNECRLCHLPLPNPAEEKEKDIEELDLHEMSIKTPCGVDADSKCYILEKKINELIRWTKSAEKEFKNI